MEKIPAIEVLYKNGNLILPERIAAELEKKGVTSLRISMLPARDEQMAAKGIREEEILKIVEVQQLERVAVEMALSVEGALSGSDLRERIEKFTGGAV
jgi:3-methyladenine DNA glycosylase AlkD